MSEKYQSCDTAAARDVLAERQRQVVQRGCSAWNDDAYVRGELGRAGSVVASIAGQPRTISTGWPWPNNPFKPTDSRRTDMVKAAALLLAEIERLDRAELIQHEVVRRDGDGFWSHSLYMAEIDGEPTSQQCDDWFRTQRLECAVISMEADLSCEDYDRIQADNDDYGCVGWEPSHPKSPGWFVLSIHDTEDGPVCIYGRRY